MLFVVPPRAHAHKSYADMVPVMRGDVLRSKACKECGGAAQQFLQMLAHSSLANVNQVFLRRV